MCWVLFKLTGKVMSTLPFVAQYLFKTGLCHQTVKPGLSRDLQSKKESVYCNTKLSVMHNFGVLCLVILNVILSSRII
jgi:hypothetical protein